jgi:phosphoribosyl-ATP pyrophosphohydrolase
VRVGKTAINCNFSETSLCFVKSLTKLKAKIIKNPQLSDLQKVISSRRGASEDTSYVAKLLKKGPRKPAQKLVEEAGELAIAAVSQGRKEQISEAADLMFHLLVLCESLEIDFNDILKELKKREGMSGIEEKAKRKDA